MGDAGPLGLSEAVGGQNERVGLEHETHSREVTVLVTGFGVRTFACAYLMMLNLRCFQS